MAGEHVLFLGIVEVVSQVVSDTDERGADDPCIVSETETATNRKVKSVRRCHVPLGCPTHEMAAVILKK